MPNPALYARLFSITYGQFPQPLGWNGNCTQRGSFVSGHLIGGAESFNLEEHRGKPAASSSSHMEVPGSEQR